MELSPRLMAIAKEVKEGEIVADIGTDHGYLPIYLLKHGFSPKVYASDINKGPLQSCFENARVYGVADRVVIKQGPGTAPIKGIDIDLVIIAGMGGQLIIEILEESKVLLDRGIPFLVQPMQQQRELRKYLYNNNYWIEKDALVMEGEKVYEFLRIRHTGVSNLKTPHEMKSDLPLEKQFELGFFLKDQPKHLRDKFLKIKLIQKEKILNETEGKSGPKVRAAREKALEKKKILEEALKWL